MKVIATVPEEMQIMNDMIAKILEEKGKIIGNEGVFMLLQATARDKEQYEAILQRL